jgi:putative addiction module component (TIGR02574 family)
MVTAAIRQKLHNYLETANDKKVKAIYTMVEDEIENTAVEYTDEFKKELDRRYAAYKNGTSKAVTATESKKRIQKLLKSARK